MQTSSVIKLVLTSLIDFVTSAWVIKLVITFSGNLCVLINIYFSFCFLWKSTIWCHRLAMLPPSRSYDPELPSNTRQMIVYLAFLPPFPLRSHALYTSVTHSSHYTAISCFYISSFDLLWVLYLIIFLFSWSMLASGILPSLSIFWSALSKQCSASCHMPWVLKVVLSCFA